MDIALDEKLINLAFNPGATDAEAINAFLIYRRKYAKVPMLNTKPVKKPTSAWDIVLAPKNFDCFIKSLSTWKKTPFYVINITTDRTRLVDAWKFELVCEFDNEDERVRFRKYLLLVFKDVIA